MIPFAFIRADNEGPELVWKDYILKRELHVRDAWEIGLHDIDIAGICKGDDLILPKDAKSAPVIEVLNSMKRRQE